MLLHYSHDLPLQLLPVHICHILCAEQEALQGRGASGLAAAHGSRVQWQQAGPDTHTQADRIRVVGRVQAAKRRRSGPISSRARGAEWDRACSPPHLLGQLDLVILVLWLLGRHPAKPVSLPSQVEWLDRRSCRP